MKTPEERAEQVHAYYIAHRENIMARERKRRKDPEVKKQRNAWYRKYYLKKCEERRNAKVKV